MKDNKEKSWDELVEGEDYVIEWDYVPSGPPCTVCGNPTETDHKGESYCPYCVAAFHDQYAKQDTTITMRLHNQLLTDIKETAKRQGVRHYQEFIRQVLMDAVRKSRSPKKRKVS